MDRLPGHRRVRPVTSRRTLLAILAAAVLLACVVLLASGAWTPRGRGAEPTGAVGTALVGGWASWFDVGPGLYGAAGPLLREALGPNWRGQLVEVEAGNRSTTVRLTDWCACGLRHGKPTIIDLSRDAFAELADPSVGIVAVSIELDPPEHPADARGRIEDGGPTLPATDVR